MVGSKHVLEKILFLLHSVHAFVKWSLKNHTFRLPLKAMIINIEEMESKDSNLGSSKTQLPSGVNIVDEKEKHGDDNVSCVSFINHG